MTTLVAATDADAARTATATDGRSRPSDSGTDAISVNAAAAATWSAGAAASFGDGDESLYVLPADADEKARLHMQHVVIRSLFGGNFHTPQRELFEDATKRAKILDVGCGSGSWSRDMAKQFPHALVTGIRLLVLALPKDALGSVLKELIRITKPGGYIQLHESSLEAYHFNKGDDEDERVTSGSAAILNDAVIEALRARGVDPTLGAKLKGYLSEAGLEDVQVIKRISPASSHGSTVGWGGPIGQLLLADARRLFGAMKPFLLKALDVSEERIGELIEEALDQWGD
ncbi:hypothetical protein HK405_007375 [Cladochytrium tenue]|nr:hypothetical protein HK405_007375 [Cladochytrium tenue]